MLPSERLLSPVFLALKSLPDCALVSLGSELTRSYVGARFTVGRGKLEGTESSTIYVIFFPIGTIDLTPSKA
jgi:hypothetical protein